MHQYALIVRATRNRVNLDIIGRISETRQWVGIVANSQFGSK